MFKKIIIPLEELQYRNDGFDNKYLINEGNRSISLFAITKGQEIPAQIAPNDICIYILEGSVEIGMDEKIFNMKSGELLLIPKASTYTIKITENAKLFIVRM